MISRSDIEELHANRRVQSAVASLYLPVPLDLAAHRGLPSRARELIRSAADQAEWSAEVRQVDLEAIAKAVSAHAHEWLGHTIAIFACAEIGLFETMPLPSYITARAVVGARPHIRPLLIALQRSPAYRAAVIDRRHAWIFAIADNRIETVAERSAVGVPSPGFAGWYGLEAYRVQQRVIQLSRQHFRDTIGVLERTSDGDQRPLIIGGHETEVSQFLTILPRSVRQSVAGSFNVDLRTLTPARVRELATPVLARWTEISEAQLVADVLDEPPNTSVMTDLAGSMTAVRSHAVGHLILPDDQLIPGFACDDCEALGTTARACDCPDPESACRGVPDLLDELAGRVLDDGGQVTSVRNPPFAAAARLRFPVAVGSR